MKPLRLLQEILIVFALAAFGLIALPAIVFVVGQQLIGEYENGMGGFYEAIAAALAEGNVFAWTLVFSPYFVFQLVRFSLWLRHQRKAVN